MTVAIKIRSPMCKNGDIIHFEIKEQTKLTIKKSIYANILVIIYLFHDHSN